MPATMAGSRGGAIGDAVSATWPAFYTSLLAGRVPFGDLADRLVGHVSPRTVTLVLNNTCNLRCAHCYLQVERLTAPVLTREEWLKVVTSVAEAEPELVCLSGKEIFIDAVGPDVLLRLHEERRRLAGRFRTGLITNGTLLHRYRESVRKAAPSYLDISLDGMSADHDAVRGAGAFARAWPNLVWAVQEYGERFFVNLTLQKQNHRRFIETIAFLGRNGVRNVELGFYIPLGYTAPALALEPSDVVEILDELHRLEALAPREPLHVHLDLDTLTLEPLLAFLRSSWFDPKLLREDEKGEVFLAHELANGVRLDIRIAPLPVGIWRSMRLTAEGNYLAAEDTLDTRLYSERAVGNIRDFDYDFGRLHAHAVGSGRLSVLLREYYDTVLPRLSDAFSANPNVRTFPNSGRVAA